MASIPLPVLTSCLCLCVLLPSNSPTYLYISALRAGPSLSKGKPPTRFSHTLIQQGVEKDGSNSNASTENRRQTKGQKCDDYKSSDENAFTRGKRCETEFHNFKLNPALDYCFSLFSQLFLLSLPGNVKEIRGFKWWVSAIRRH